MEISVSELKQIVDSFGVDVKIGNNKPSITIAVTARENGRLYHALDISGNNNSIPAYKSIDRLGVYDLGKTILWVVKK